MPSPKLTFFSETGKEELLQVFTDNTIDFLKKMDAGVSLAILDLSEERASLVKRLKGKGIPVTAWLLLPEENGYWFNIGNYHSAEKFYTDFVKWSNQNQLIWHRIGLDFEPDIRDWDQFFIDRGEWVKKSARRLVNRNELKNAKIAYSNLIKQMNSDGYEIETYHFPLINDERKSRSQLLQKISGVVDIRADREVWMVYSSFLRPNGAGFLASYSPEAHIVALGSTGGGFDNERINIQPLDWIELARDLRLTWYWCDEIYIFSLEGCINQGFLERLLEFKWDEPIILPSDQANRVNSWRSTFRTGLWIFSHPVYILLVFLGFFTSIKILKWILKK